MLKIGFFGDGPWADKTLKKISNNNKFSISFIVSRFKQPDQKLKKWSKKLDVDFISFENINSSQALAKLKKYDADLFVSMSFDQILKKDIIYLPKMGFLNCHAGALPFYRGRNILNWALINDEKEFGVTVHFIDEGIDTGDIILQKKRAISNKDDYSTLLKKAESLCAECLYESIIKVESGSFKRIKQKSIHPQGSYFFKRKKGDERINWNSSSRDVFNFVRALTDPGPCAQTIHDKKIIKLRKVKIPKIRNIYQGVPGEVVLKRNMHVFIKTKDSVIKLSLEDSLSTKNQLLLQSLNLGDYLK
tara:strand:+ start:987 stop:1898 length:912 start_codon:yes stop_codon:yes gene_type:complete